MSPTVRDSHVEWFRSTLYTRLEPGGTIIVIATRWHEADLSGWLSTQHGDKWQVINLPAIADENDILGRLPGEALCPQRYNEAALGSIKISIGSRLWASLYQGRPSPAEGAIWKKHNWKRWTALPETFDDVIQSWDTNIVEDGSSFAVGQIWGKKGADRFLLDQIRGKWGFSELIVKFLQFSQKWPAALRKVVENKANGPALQSQLKSKVTGIVLVEPEGGKVVRAMAAEPELEAGNVWIPSNEVEYPWVREFIEEASVFPNGENDDQVDAASQALNHFRSTGEVAFGGKDRKRRARSPFGSRGMK
jgi:predicted phage terminase large subunit-like protein